MIHNVKLSDEAQCIKNNFEFIISPACGCINFCKHTNDELKATNPFNMQSEFTALQGALYT